MFDKPPHYRSFLLTLWEERSQDPSLPSVWRFRLEDPHTGQQRGFADMDALVAALEQEMAGQLADEEQHRKEVPQSFGDQIIENSPVV